MLRLLDRNKRGSIQIFPIIMTFVASATWHGLAEGYFVFFIAMGILDFYYKLAPKTTLAAAMRNILPPEVMTALSWLWMHGHVAYFSVGFVLIFES